MKPHGYLEHARPDPFTVDMNCAKCAELTSLGCFLPRPGDCSIRTDDKHPPVSLLRSPYPDSSYVGCNRIVIGPPDNYGARAE